MRKVFSVHRPWLWPMDVVGRCVRLPCVLIVAQVVRQRYQQTWKHPPPLVLLFSEPPHPPPHLSGPAGLSGLFLRLCRAALPLLAIAQTIPAWSQEHVEGAAALREAVRAKPVVRVLARIKAPPAPGDTAETLGVKSRLARTMAEDGGPRVTAIPDTPFVVLEVDKVTAERLLRSGDVTAVQEDIPEKASLADSGPLVRAPDAWTHGARGAGTAIAVLDTGVDTTHPFLSGRIVAEACFSTTLAAQGATSLCPDGSGEQIDAGAAHPCGIRGCDHGTHVAGIAAGRGGSFSGMAPAAGIVAIQVFTRFDDRPDGPMFCAGSGMESPCLLSYPSDQIRALAYVRSIAPQENIVAANMSLGGGDFTGYCTGDFRRPVIQALRDENVAAVIAAGNEGFTDAVNSPGCIPEAITVGSTTKSDGVSGFSNSAFMIDLLAPGSGINSSIPDGGFAVFNGTSMATPHVAGAIAALRSVDRIATVDQMEAALKNAGHMDRDGRNGLSFPRIDIAGALRSLTPPEAVYAAGGM